MSKFTRFAVAAFAAGFAGALSFGSQAATLTLSDPNCSDFTLTPPAQQGGSWALSCSAIPQAPTCTLTPSTSSPVIDTNLTLTASCSHSPTSYAWTGCNPVGSASSTCTTTQAGTGLASYSVTATNGVGPGPAATTAVTWVASAPAVVAPSGCTITPSTSSLPVGGGAVNLAVSCTGGSAPTNFAWSGGGLTQSGPSNQASANITATTTFSVVASNSAGPAPSTSTTVAVQTGTGGGGAISCAAQGYATTRTINLGWASTLGNVTAVTSSVGGFGANTAMVVTFTTPATGNSRVGNITTYEFGDPPTYRTIVLSTAPCGGGTVLGTTEGTTTPLYFTVGGSLFGYPTLQTSTMYYITIVNRQNGLEQCFGSCNAKIELSKPKGL